MSIVSRSTQQYSGFDPRTIPGCALWLDGADRNTISFSSGSTVSQWRDKSGNGHALTAVNTVTYDSNGLLMSGSVSSGSGNLSGFTNSTFSVDFRTRTVIMVFTQTNNQYAQFLGFGPTGSSIFTANDRFRYALNPPASTGDIFANNGNTLLVTTSATITFNRRNIWIDVGSTSTPNISFFVNGTGSGTGNIGATAPTTRTTAGIQICRLPTGASTIANEFFNGYIHEIIVYESTLTTAQRQQVEGYLAWKWSLTTNAGLVSPSTIPGLALWLDAADRSTVTLVNGTVNSVADKSGNGFTLTGGSGFTYNNTLFQGRYPSFFNNSSVSDNKIGSNVAFTLNQPMTVFATGVMLSPGDNDMIFDGNTKRVTIYNASANLFVGPGSQISPGGTHLLNPYIVCGIVNTTASSVLVNGTTISSGTLGTDPLSSIVIGNRTGGSGSPYRGHLCEFLIFAGALTTTQRQQVEGYLAWKWGLQRSLPTSHPYVSSFALPTSHPFGSTPVFTRPFLPIDIDGLALWLDAADSSTLSFSSGSNVSQWRDKSGNGILVTQATSSNQPTYANNTLTFSGNQVLNTNLSSYVLQQTVFCVCSTSATDTNQRAILGMNGSGSAGGYVFYIGTNITGSLIQRVHTWGGNPGTNGAVFIRNQVYLYGATVNSSTGSCVLYSNGSQSGSGSVASLVANANMNYVIGAGLGSIGEPLQGTISEMIIFNSILTTSQRQQVEGYLAAKWGLSTSLPPAIQAVPSIFDPRTISGCQLWLDAADPAGTGVVPANGASIATWVDKSGNSRNFTGTNVPTYSSSSNELVFNGTNTVLSNTTNIPTTSQNYPVFVVFRPAVTSRGRLIELRVNGQIQIAQVDTTFVNSSTASSNSYVGPLTVTTNTRVLYESFANSATDIRYAINGVVNNNWAGNDATTAQTTNSFLVGGVSTVFYNGGINEVLLFNRYLTTTERQTIEGYLYAKWNIPLTRHPYYRIQSLPTTPIFTPASLSGLALWLDAADSSTLSFSSGSNVNQWRDKATGVIAQYTTGIGSVNPPVSGSTINGVNALLFDQTLLPVTASLNTTNRTYFIVANLLNGYTNGTGAIFWTSTVVNSYVRGATMTFESTRITLANQNVANLLFLNSSLNSNSIISATFNNGTTGMWNNGGGTTTATGQSSSAFGSNGSTDNSFVIGGTTGNMEPISSSTAGYFSRMLFGEMLIYNSSLTASQRQAVEGYLAWKWGLQNNLPLNFNRTIQSPLQISGCQLWLDAADASTVTGTTSVTQWRDKSSNAYQGAFSSGRNFSYVTNIRNGLSAIQTATGQTMTIANFAIRQTMSIFHVYMPINQANGSAFIEQGPDAGLSRANPGFWFHARTNEQFRITTTGNTNAVNTATVSQSNVWQLIEGISPDPANGNQMTFWLNGTLLVSGSANPDNTLITNTLYINGRNNTDLLSYPTYIAEIIIYNRALTSIERQSVEAYLQNKWNIAVPTAHPYKNFRP